MFNLVFIYINHFLSLLKHLSHCIAIYLFIRLFLLLNHEILEDRIVHPSDLKANTVPRKKITGTQLIFVE